jgi:hypothetical protein
VYIPHNNIFTYVHGKKYCGNMCKKATGGNRENGTKCFMQKLMFAIEAKGGKSRVC